jgi:glycosyltransferase involved in cell wall biosynthesis
MLSEKTKILFLVGGFSIGGTERHLSQVLPRLISNNRSLQVCAFGADGSLSAPLRDAGIPIKFITPRNTLSIPRIRGVLNLFSQIQQLAEEIRRLRPGIVHCFLPEPCAIGWLASMITGRTHRLVMSKRSQLARPGAFLGDKILEIRALRSADQVIGHSQVVAQELAGCGVNSERLNIIHNGIELTVDPNQRLEFRSIHGWGEETTVFVVLANLIPYKGHAELIHALSTYEMEVSTKWALVLVGGGVDLPHGQFLRRQAIDSGIGSKIHFIGQMNDPTPWLAAADVGILLSHHEGFSNAVIEYMAASLPVIATAVGGNLDAVADRLTGWLVPLGDQPALKRALIECQDLAIRSTRGKAGFRRYHEEFTLERCVKKYDDFYASLATEASI